MRGVAKLTTNLVPFLAWRPHSRREEAVRFEVDCIEEAASAPLAGRLFVMLTRREHVEPRLGPSWFRPEPFLAIDVERLKPGQSVRLDRRADSFPEPLSELPPGRYWAQAVLHRSAGAPHPGTAAGNLYSDRTEFEVPAAGSRRRGRLVRLALRHHVAPRGPLESPWGRELLLASPRLTAFHGHPIEQRATVILPASYWSRPRRRYPVIYAIPGFGGSHRSLQWQRLAGKIRPRRGQAEFIRVMLTGKCEWGHHAYANSATNGPRGDALVDELIPAVDREFRTLADPAARFLTGHSSGGWAALWLQINYPEAFGGAWSIAPDPLDFRAFQGIDLYATPPENMYRDPFGNRRPLARIDDRVAIWCDDFCRMDECLKRGGQMRCFESVFSPLDEDGLPRRLWDRGSGRIDPETARAWEAFDIRLVLERNWDRLEPLLRRKLHIEVGDRDTFYLDHAVRRLRDTLVRLGSDATVDIAEGLDHMTILSARRAARRVREITKAFRSRVGRRHRVVRAN